MDGLNIFGDGSGVSIFTFMGRCGELLLYQRIFLPGKDKVFVVSLADRDSRWVLSLRVFSKDILSLVLENRFRDRATDPQHDALFEILNREDVFAILTDRPWKIHHIPVPSRSLPSVGARISYIYSCICSCLVFSFGCY